MEAIADLELIDYELNLSYDSYSVIDVLNTVLPKKINPHMITIGSIVYVNLAEEHLEHMNVIGEVVADKREATSVIGLQNGEVVVLAGNSDLSTEFVEREATIHADLSKCFWSALL
jgi:tRNA G37 N-methylase Trm5